MSFIFGLEGSTTDESFQVSDLKHSLNSQELGVLFLILGASRSTQYRDRQWIPK